MDAPFQTLFAGLLALALLASCTSASNESTPASTTITPSGSETTTPGESTDSAATPTVVADPDPTTETDSSGPEPSISSEDELAAIALATRIGVDKLAVWTPVADGSVPDVVAVVNTTASTFEINDGWAWADNKFIYGSVHSDGAPPSATVLAYDGTIVCQLFGDVHHATARADGSIVVAVDTTDYSQEPAIHTAAAHDCSTGDRQPIESWIEPQSSGEFHEYTFVERVAGRVFRLAADVEGNAQATNESGLSINGNDYAGDHVFSADGSVVVYADFTTLIHVSRSLRARDTTTGELLWSVELERPYISLTIVDDLVLVGIPAEKDDGYYLDGAIAESVLVLNLASGQAVDDIETDLQIIGAG